MKKIRNWIYTILFLYSSNCYASHAAGGYFEYECIGNGNYRVDFYFLRQCGSGNPEAPNFMVYDIFNSCGVSCGLNTVNAALISFTEIDFGCGNNCSGGDVETGPSTQLYKYSAIVNLSLECASWYISTNIYARNTVTYAESNFATDYYTYCMINNTAGICNSSVKYSGIPFAIGCSNGLGKSMYSINNLDGNLLTYSFVNPLVGDCTSNGPVNFIGGASVSMPYPSNGNFVLNNTNGEFTFEPNSIGTSYFAIKVSEFSGPILVGETIIDGLVFSSSNCELGGTIDFGNWQGYNGSVINITEVEQEYCGTINLSPNVNGESITNVTINSLDFVDHTIIYNQNGTATVEVCVIVPLEYLCYNLDILVIAEASTNGGGCITQLTGTGYSGYYTFFKPKGEYCPDNLFFTNRNPTSGILMPLTARAEERIWVGDNMPGIAGSLTLGDVVIQNNTTLRAGIEIILPSCMTGGADCITMEGNVTLIIEPNSCSSECASIPLELFVHEIFACGNERLEAEVQGNGPFTYIWSIAGQTITTSNNTLSIHDIVSILDNGQNPYSLEVYDAVGNTGSFSGEILGTLRFYQPITNNMNWYSGFGYMYQQVSVIDNSQPASIYDEVNWIYNQLEDPPYYGATRIEFTVWPLGGGGGGATVYDTVFELQNVEDFSINNFEVSWNGHLQNDLNQPCVQVGSYNYTLIAKNCLYVHTQQHHFTYAGGNCYWGELNDIEAKSMVTPNVTPKATFFNENESSLIAEKAFLIIPNPSQKDFSIYGNYGIIQQLKVMDANSKVIMEETDITANSIINVESLASGIYQVYLITDKGDVTVLKFVKM